MLERGTEQIWLDFSSQYKTKGNTIQQANKRAMIELKKKYAEEEGTTDGQPTSRKIQKTDEGNQSMMKRVWNIILDNFELRQEEESSEPEDIFTSDVETPYMSDDGKPQPKKLNKRQKKQQEKELASNKNLTAS